jgi:phenylacetate-coenzyme A ligase PaaK-like adenylate-forming protein
MYFSAREMEIFSTLAAISNLLQRTIMPDDIVQVSTSARAALANTVFIGACQRTGALVYQTGIVDLAQTLVLLSESHNIPAKKARASVLLTYPSYLGKLVTYGLANGFTPADFGLKQIFIGGEIVTQALKRRCQALFGDIEFSEAYGITETYPFVGTVCEQDHLHFDSWSGLMEVVDVESGAATAPGEIGTLVLTPFMPFRESMVILRYDTQDLVETLAGSCTCSLQKLPAAGRLLGKRRFALWHDQGLTTPRHVLEAIEAVDAVPLPARCCFYLRDGMLTIEVAVPQASSLLRAQIEQSLQTHGVAYRVLEVVTDPAHLTHPLPLRGDLTERSFETLSTTPAAPVAIAVEEHNVADPLAA